jgi:hypothetical protein
MARVVDLSGVGVVAGLLGVGVGVGAVVDSASVGVVAGLSGVSMVVDLPPTPTKPATTPTPDKSTTNDTEEVKTSKTEKWFSTKRNKGFSQGSIDNLAIGNNLIFYAFDLDQKPLWHNYNKSSPKEEQVQDCIKTGLPDIDLQRCRFVAHISIQFHCFLCCNKEQYRSFF